jgi:hypothetical protein
MKLTRRAFFAGIAAARYLSASRRPGMILEAISAPSLPDTIVIPGLTGETSGVFELREYQSANPALLNQLHEQFLSGAFPCRPLLWRNEPNFKLGEARLRYLFRFGSLAARAEAWTAFASDPAWIRFQADVRPAGVSVYVGQRYAPPRSAA